MLGDDGVFLFPTYPKLAPLPFLTFLGGHSVMFTGLFNAMQFPSTQVPLGLSNEGLPLGIQVVSRPGNDHLTLALALELEKAFGGWKKPPFKVVHFRKS